MVDTVTNVNWSAVARGLPVAGDVLQSGLSLARPCTWVSPQGCFVVLTAKDQDGMPYVSQP